MSKNPNSLHGSVLPQNRTFGLVFTGIFFLIAAYNWLTDSAPIYSQTFGGLSIVFLLATVIAPTVLAPLNKAWYQLGLLMGRVVSPLVLGVLFFVVITPVALFMRLIGRDALRIKKQHVNSYWIERDPPGPNPESFKDQFWK